ncbi:MAG: hypothetical protein ACKVS8_13030 [Phycisphaerales bacterium]
MAAPSPDMFAREHEEQAGARHDRLRTTLLITIVATQAFALSVVVLLLMRGAGWIGADRQETLILAGLAGLVLWLIGGPASVLLAFIALESSSLAQRVDAMTVAVRSMAAQSVLSDDARRVLNRSTEREVLRRAIMDDIGVGDWESGLLLCRELADRFGYRADAEELRQKIDQARLASIDSEVREGMALVDGLILQRQFAAAVREAGRLARLHSEEPRVAALPARVAEERERYKAELRQRFLDAAKMEQSEEAMKLMKEMDGYLSPAEGEQLREVARGVVGKVRDHLGEQFRQAVQAQSWGEAATIGRRIVQDFPNTKMAAEVRGMLDNILARANATAA